MTTFLAIADVSAQQEKGSFRLEKARIGVLHGGHIYTYLPNDSSWIYNEAVERDYFADRTELRYKELPASLAQNLAMSMRPVNPLVATMLLDNAKRYPKIPFRQFRSLSSRRKLMLNSVEIAKWIRSNGVSLPKGTPRAGKKRPVARASNFYEDSVDKFLQPVTTVLNSLKTDRALRSLGLGVHVIDKNVKVVTGKYVITSFDVRGIDIKSLDSLPHEGKMGHCVDHGGMESRGKYEGEY